MPELETTSFHPGDNPGANLKSIPNRCYPILVAFVWELTKKNINPPLGCLGGVPEEKRAMTDRILVALSYYSFSSKSASWRAQSHPCRARTRARC